MLIVLVVTGLASTRFFRIVELNGFDRLVGVARQPRPAPQIAFVDITDATVKQLGDWPIPRDKVAQAIDRIAAGTPELIGLDMILAEKRRPDQDNALARALAAAGNVVVATHRTEKGLWEEPLPLFRDAALDVGAVSFYPDEDGAVRRAPLVVGSRDGDEKPLLGFAALLATNTLRTPLERVRPGLVRLGPTELAVDDTRGDVPSILIGEWAAPGVRLDLLDVLGERFDPRVLEGRIVVVGESSQPAKDRYATPLYGRQGLVSGSEIHIAALATLLDGRAVRTVTRGPKAIVNFAAALLALGLVISGRPSWAVPAVVALGAIAFGGAWWLLGARHTWLPFVSTEAALLLSLSAALGYRFLRGDEQERRLRELFTRYVSNDVLQEILRHPEGVAIEGQERTASVLFADIRGFTARSAGQPPREVIAWLNGYFAAMSAAIEHHGGFLNKFIGDGLMVVFGVPVSEGEQRDAERALRAGLEMLERLRALNCENAQSAARGLWRPPIRIGIGIHTGPLAAGNVGAPRRMEYSVIGETVNLAARLQSATRRFEDADLVISPSTERLVRERFVVEPLGTFEAKGFSEPVPVYAVRSERPVVPGDAP